MGNCAAKWVIQICDFADKPGMVQAFASIWVLFGLVAAGLVHAANGDPCDGITQYTLKELTSPRPEFTHTNTYSHRVRTTPVCDQEAAGICWIYATLGELQTSVFHRTGTALNLSESHLDVISLRTRAFDALRTPMQEIPEGGWTNNAYWLVQHHGIVPESAWTPRIKLTDREVRPMMMRYLNDEVGRYHMEAAKVTDPAARDALRKKAEARIIRLIEGYTGPLPTAVLHEGQMVDPVTYARAVLPLENLKVLRASILHDPIPNRLSEIANAKLKYRGPPRTQSLPYDLSVEEVEETARAVEQRIAESIQKGQSVPVEFEVDHAFFDSQSGIISIGAYHLPEGYYPLPQFYRQGAGTSGGSHAVEVVGVDLGSDGRVIKYLIKNSWGRDAGEEGYYHMYADYFENYVLSAYFRTN